MAVFDRETGKLIPEFYTWADYTQWDPGGDLTWDLLDGSYTSSLGVPDLTFTTEIIDFGRTAWVNPLCTAITSGTHSIQVFAAESIDSSSLLPGDAVIDTDLDTTPGAVYGRYFQFKVNVFDGVDSFVRGVQTNLSATTQAEFITDVNSSTHAGTTAARIVPLTRSYSKILALSGTAKLSNYGVDSSSIDIVQIVDQVSGVPITTTGTTATVTEDNVKWAPASIEMPKGTGSSMSVDLTSLQTDAEDWTVEFWWKHSSNSDVGRIFAMDFGGTNELSIEARYDSGNGYWRFQLLEDNNTIGVYTDDSAISDETNRSSHNDNYYYHFFITKTTGTQDGNNTTSIHAYVGVAGQTTTLIGADTQQDDSSRYHLGAATIRWGDFDSTGTGTTYIDDIRVTEADVYDVGIFGLGYTAPPTGELVALSQTKVLINGGITQEVSSVNVPIVVHNSLNSVTAPSYAVYNASGEAINATVNLRIEGMPRMQVDANNNIIES